MTRRPKWHLGPWSAPGRSSTETADVLTYEARSFCQMCGARSTRQVPVGETTDLIYTMTCSDCGNAALKPDKVRIDG